MLGNTKIETRSVPVNFGPMGGADSNFRFKGPCDDTMEYWLKISNDSIIFATFTTDGCYYSLLCGSIAAKLIENSTLEEALEISQEKVLEHIGEVPDDHKHCAKLAATTIKFAILDYQKKNHTVTDHPVSKEDQKPALDKNLETDLSSKMKNIKKKIVVLSGKGGVGKSTIAVNLAMSLALSGKKVGLMDIDIHGPSIPTMLNLKKSIAEVEGNKVIPIQIGNLSVISIGFFVDKQDMPIIWRGPMKATFIQQFVKDVMWGELDYLIIDSPPGTGDEPLTVCQAINDLDGAVIVTTPQDVAVADVSKSINFCMKLGIPIIGIIENMSKFICPNCKSSIEVFNSGGGLKLSNNYNVPYLGSIPLDPSICSSGDEGDPFVKLYPESPNKIIFDEIINKIIKK
jgi:ATP-binding protein involved in chromosome partitioning